MNFQKVFCVMRDGCVTSLQSDLEFIKDDDNVLPTPAFISSAQARRIHAVVLTMTLCEALRAGAREKLNSVFEHRKTSSHNSTTKLESTFVCNLAPFRACGVYDKVGHESARLWSLDGESAHGETVSGLRARVGSLSTHLACHACKI